jgi:hypothetical protein
MILKNADDKSEQLATLEALLATPGLPQDKKKLIERELIMFRAGLKGERESAYDLDFDLGPAQNIMVLHDLRFEINGRVAQIDHLAINRVLDMFVLETKHFSQGISINDSGEFLAWYGKDGVGIASPLEQNRRHIEVLKDVINSINMPTRMGFKLKPTFNSIVLISKNSRISRSAKFDSSGVIKSDQFMPWLDKFVDKGVGLAQVSKIVSQETVTDIANQLIALHKPLVPNYRAKFGLTEKPKEPPVVLALEPQETVAAVPASAPVEQPKPQAVQPAEPVQPAPAETKEPGEAEGKKSKLQCFTCLAAVPYNVAKFCWFNKKRFCGNVYCVECQKAF